MGETVSIEEYENLNEEELLETIKGKENELEEIKDEVDAALLIINKRNRIESEIRGIKRKFESLQPRSPKTHCSETPRPEFYYTLKYTGGRTTRYGCYSTRENAESMIPKTEYYGEYEVLEILIEYNSYKHRNILRKLDKTPMMYEDSRAFCKREKMPHLRKYYNPSLKGFRGKNKHYNPRYHPEVDPELYNI